MQILAYSCQSVELLLQFDPDVVGDEGNIARQSLVDGLLYSNARLDNIEQSFAFGNVDQADYDSSRGVKDEFAVSEVVSDGEGEVKQVHLQKQEGFVLGRPEVDSLEGGDAGQFLVVDILVVPERGLLEFFSIRHQPQQFPKLHVRFHPVTKLLNCSMFQIIAAGNEAKFGRHCLIVPRSLGTVLVLVLI